MIVLFVFVLSQTRSAETGEAVEPHAPAARTVTSFGRAGGLATLVTHNTATLSWQPVDDPRVEGYEVWKGKTPDNLGATKVGKVTSYTFEDLGQGYIWYFRVSAYDKNGKRGELSNMVMKVIPKIKGSH